MRAHNPLTRETLPLIVYGEPLETEGDAPVDASAAEVEGMRSLWDHGERESTQFAAKLRAVAEYWPAGECPGLDARDEADYLVAQALRTTVNHASRLLLDARKATAHLPRLLGLLDAGVLPARWFTLVLRRTTDLTDTQLAEVDDSIADWDLRVDEDRFGRRLSALVRWVRDRDETAHVAPERAVTVHPPDEDGTAGLQVHGPAPEILALGRRLDSAARAVQKAQRHALEKGEEIPFDDGTVAERGAAMSLSRLRYEILTRSVLETGGVEVPKERFRINVTVPALTLLGIENGPGVLDGIHPIPAAMARELAAGNSTWYRILTDPTCGAFLPLPAERYPATKEMLEYLRLVFPVCAVPGCTRPSSWAAENDHIQEYLHHDPEAGGQTEIANLHPLCWRHHQMKTAGILDPVKESITHAVTRVRGNTASDGAAPDGAGPKKPSGGDQPSPAPARSTTPPAPARSTIPPDAPPPDSPQGMTPPRHPQSDQRPPGEATDASADLPPGPEPIICYEPGVTHWTVRGGSPRGAEDECDLVTPWITGEFTARWNEVQERRAAHHAQQARPGGDGDATGTQEPPEPPPF